MLWGLPCRRCETSPKNREEPSSGMGGGDQTPRFENRPLDSQRQAIKDEERAIALSAVVLQKRGLFAMADSVQSYNRKLSDEAKQLEKAGQFAEAAELYKQVYDAYLGSFVTSHSIRCLRKQGKPMEAIEFGRQLEAVRKADAYVHKELSWAMYEVVLQKSREECDGREASPLAQLRRPLQTGRRGTPPAPGCLLFPRHAFGLS